LDKVRHGPAWPFLAPAVFAGAVVLYAVAVPLGLSRVEAAAQVAAGIDLDTSTRPVPFALLAIRLAQFIPLGDAPFRANLASAILAAVAIALLGRLCVEVVALLRPPSNARQASHDFLHEPFAAVGAAFAAALCLGTFAVGSTAGSAAATLVVVAAGLLAAFALFRDSGNRAAGLGLAALSGLAGGVDPIAGPLLWPPLLGLSFLALRKGSRWPLLVPLCFVAVWGASALASVAAASGGLSLARLLATFGATAVHSGSTLPATALELCDELGVVGSILAAIGIFVLATRAALIAAWLILTVVTSLFFAHSPQHSSLFLEPTRAALPAATFVAGIFVSAGLLHVAGKLGRARMAAALALAVILVFSPAMDGGQGRWLPRSDPAMHLLDIALARTEIRSVVFPGTVEMDGLFRLAHSLALRPDLAISKHGRHSP